MIIGRGSVEDHIPRRPSPDRQVAAHGTSTRKISDYSNDSLHEDRHVHFPVDGHGSAPRGQGLGHRRAPGAGEGTRLTTPACTAAATSLHGHCGKRHPISVRGSVLRCRPHRPHPGCGTSSDRVSYATRLYASSDANAPTATSTTAAAEGLDGEPRPMAVAAMAAAPAAMVIQVQPTVTPKTRNTTAATPPQSQSCRPLIAGDGTPPPRLITRPSGHRPGVAPVGGRPSPPNGHRPSGVPRARRCEPAGRSRERWDSPGTQGCRLMRSPRRGEPSEESGPPQNAGSRACRTAKGESSVRPAESAI